MFKTREDVDQAIAELRATIRSHEAGELSGLVRSSLQEMTKLLDYLERQVEAVGWPPATPGAYDNVRIGLYAVRNLDEFDDGRLSLRICILDNHLKGR